ncbi:MAG TPA: hypothetical protein VNT53_03725 [Pseudolysinimonas sp.]|nr:hypothetical protein [Pseudolysinimonas sp.]
MADIDPPTENDSSLPAPESHAAPPAEAPVRKPSQRTLIAVIAGAAVLLLVIAGGAFAAILLLGSGGSPTASAVAFPSSTTTWVEVAIDPSLQQKAAAGRVLQNLSEVNDFIGDNGPDIDPDDPDIKRSLWEWIVEDSDSDIDTNLDYDDDIAPWLGSRVAFGLVGSADSMEEAALVAIEARNVDRGVEAVKELVDDLDIDNVEVGSHEGYVIISHEDLDLKKAYSRGTLSSTEAFTEGTKDLGSWGLASYWSSPYANAKAGLAWADDSSDSPELARDYWEDQVRSEVDSWEEDVEEYQTECLGLGTTDDEFSFCYYDEEPTRDTFFEDYGYYPEEADDQIDELLDAAKDRHRAQAESARAVVDALSPTGSVASIVRVADDSIEIVSRTHDLKLTEFADPKNSTALAQLPENTMFGASASQLGSIIDTAFSPEYAAVGMSASFMAQGVSPLAALSGMASGGYPGARTLEGEAFPDNIENAREEASDWFDENFELKFPDDLADLFGTNTVLAVDSDLNCDVSELTAGEDECSDPQAGLLVYSDDTDATEDAIGKVTDGISSETDASFTVESDDGRVAVGRGDYVDDLLAADGKLGDKEQFRRALPDLRSSSAALYLDVQALRDMLEDEADVDDDSLDMLDGILAVGSTTSKTGSGDTRSVTRIVTGE